LLVRIDGNPHRLLCRDQSRTLQPVGTYLKALFWNKANRRTGEAVQQRTKQIVILLTLLTLSPRILVSQLGAGVSGTVRDTHGKPATGVSVELIGPVAAAAVLTDLHGRYEINGVLPGVYQLRASAALSLPSLRRQLRLVAGVSSTVNLTMSGTSGEASWEPRRRRDPVIGIEDWKWTLRSPANRPMLRLTDDGGIGHGDRKESREHRETHFGFSAGTAYGEFGNSGEYESVIFAHRSSDQKKTSSLGYKLAKPQKNSSASFSAVSGLFEAESDTTSKRRASLSVRSFPQVVTLSGEPLTELAFSSAERINISEVAIVEVGSETRVLHAGKTRATTYPFLCLLSHPTAGWTASYAFATSPEVAGYDDVGIGGRPTPVAISGPNGLLSEAGKHHEIAAKYGLGRSSVQVAYHHDTVPRSPLSGMLKDHVTTPSLSGRMSGEAADAMALDISNGTFKVFGPSFSADGYTVLTNVSLAEGFSLLGGYLTSTGVTVAGANGNATQERIRSEISQAFVAAVKARSARTGTQMSASYRWQPATTISVVAPYDVPGVEPYLGVHFRQAIPGGGTLPGAVEIVVEGSNVLGEGYQSYSIGKQEALLASALRELRVGIIFTF